MNHFLKTREGGQRGVQTQHFEPCVQELSDPNNYHEFCRLLARLKSNYQLGELVMVDNYQVVRSFGCSTLRLLLVIVAHGFAARIFVENWTRQMKRGNQKKKIQKRRIG
jgi:hypothetical protein